MAKIDRAEAVRRAQDAVVEADIRLLPASELESLGSAIADAIERAVRDTAAECAAMIDQQIANSRLADCMAIAGCAELARNAIRKKFETPAGKEVAME